MWTREQGDLCLKRKPAAKQRKTSQAEGETVGFSDQAWETEEEFKVSGWQLRKATLVIITIRVEGSYYAGSIFYYILIKLIHNEVCDSQLLQKNRKNLQKTSGTSLPNCYPLHKNLSTSATTRSLFKCSLDNHNAQGEMIQTPPTNLSSSPRLKIRSSCICLQTYHGAQKLQLKEITRYYQCKNHRLLEWIKPRMFHLC